MSENNERQHDIVSGIIDGSVRIDSIEEFKNIIIANPDNPRLLKMYAGMLEQRELFNGAASLYRKASRHFLESGMVLQALLAKILEWNIIKSSERECRGVYAALRRLDSDKVPVYNFFARMSYPELVAVMEEMEPVRVSAGTLVQEPGHTAENVCFIVSGFLKETVSHPEDGSEEESGAVAELGENDFFGDVFPLDDERVSLSRIEAFSDAELLRIEKSDITRVCRKFPNIEFLTKEMCQSRSGKGGRKSLQTIRATTRYQMQTKVTVKIFSDDPQKGPLVLNGFTEDLSLGGCCIRLGEAYWTGTGTDIIGKAVRILFNVPKVAAGIDVLGMIAWKKEVSYDERTTVLIGIQFNQMTEEDFEFLKRHCYIGDGEQDMIFSLWESLMRK